jgi:hypothetical protein
MVRFKRLWLVAGAAALLVPGIAGSAEGTITRDLGWNGGERFGVAMSAHTTFTQGPTARIVVTGPKDIVDRIIVDDGVVRLRDHLGWTWYRYPPVTIVASAPNVREVTAAASARIDIGALQQPSVTLRSSSSGQIRGTVQTQSLTMSASSSGSIRGTMRTQSLRAEASSSGTVKADGSADKVDAQAASSGDVDLRGMSVKDAILRASSSGDVVVSPSRSADAKASSSGSVRLLQRPAQLNSQTSSSGSVRVES